MPTDLGPAIFRNILNPVDGSDFAEIAGITAVELAARYSSPLTIFYVAKYPANDLGVSSTNTVSVGRPLTDPATDRLKKRAVASMERIEKYARTRGIAAHIEVIDTTSEIVNTIEVYAYQNRIDLIVIGSRGMNALKTALIGSVSEGILRQARCAAMVVR